MLKKRRRRSPTMILLMRSAMTWMRCWTNQLSMLILPNMELEWDSSSVAVAAAKEEVDVVIGKIFKLHFLIS
jgi:hypothetical protein